MRGEKLAAQKIGNNRDDRQELGNRDDPSEQVGWCSGVAIALWRFACDSRQRRALRFKKGCIQQVKGASNPLGRRWPSIHRVTGRGTCNARTTRWPAVWIWRCPDLKRNRRSSLARRSAAGSSDSSPLSKGLSDSFTSRDTTPPNAGAVIVGSNATTSR